MVKDNLHGRHGVVRDKQGGNALHVLNNIWLARKEIGGDGQADLGVSRGRKTTLSQIR